MFFYSSIKCHHMRDWKHCKKIERRGFVISVLDTTPWGRAGITGSVTKFVAMNCATRWRNICSKKSFIWGLICYAGNTWTTLSNVVVVCFFLFCFLTDQSNATTCVIGSTAKQSNGVVLSFHFLTPHREDVLESRALWLISSCTCMVILAGVLY